MNFVPLNEWPESKEHGKAVSRVIHVSMMYADGHIDTADTVETTDGGTQDCCGGGGPCNPLIDPLCDNG